MDPDARYHLHTRCALDAREVESATSEGDDVVEVVTLWGDALIDVRHVERGAAYVPPATDAVPAPWAVVVHADSGPLFVAPGAAGGRTCASMLEGEAHRADVGALTVTARRVRRGRAAVRRATTDRALLRAFVASGTLVGMLVASALWARATFHADLHATVRDRADWIARRVRATPGGSAAGLGDARREDGAAAPGANAPGEARAGREGPGGVRRPRRLAARGSGDAPFRTIGPARERVSASGLFTALGGRGALGVAVPEPFGGLNEPGDGAIHGDGGGGAGAGGGFLALEAIGTGASLGVGAGGGGWGAGTIALGALWTRGSGGGTGRSVEYGAGAGRGLRDRRTSGPIVCRCGAVVVTGLLSPEAIRRVVRRNLGQVERCHEQGLAQDPGLHGRVTVRWVIGGDGRVLGSNVSESTLAAPSVARCIADAARRWEFPAPQGGGVVTVNYPFELLPPE